MIDESIKSNRLGDDNPDISQLDQQRVKVVFKAVSFNALVKWTDSLARKYGVAVDSFSVKPSDEAGIVVGDVVLRR